MTWPYIIWLSVLTILVVAAWGDNKMFKETPDA